MIDETVFTLSGICRGLGISAYELPFAEPRLESGHVSTIFTPEAPQVWRRLFFAWLGAIEDFKAQELAQDLDKKVGALRRDPAFAKGTPGRAALKQVIADLDDALAPAFRVFRIFVLDGYETMQRERTPEAMLAARRNKLTGASRRSAYQEIVDEQRRIANEATEFRDVVKLLWAGWKDLEFWKYQPKNIHRSRGDLTLAGFYRDSAADRLDDVFELLVAFDELLNAYKNLLDELEARIPKGSPEELEESARSLQVLYEKMTQAERELLYKVGHTADRCAEWANYHAGSNFIAQLKGSSDELMAWIEVSDRAYATCALTATTLATALGTPIAGGVVGGIAVAGGLIKKKVADESIIRAYADKKGVFDLAGTVSAATLGRHKKAARKVGKKVGKAYGLVIEPGTKIAEFAVKTTHALSQTGIEALHGVGTVVGDAAKILDAVVESTKETDFSTQDRNAARSQLAVMASITNDLSSFKRAHRTLAGKWGPQLQSIGETGTSQPASVADFAAHAHKILCANWDTRNHQAPKSYDLTLGGFDTIWPPEQCYFFGPAGSGKFFFQGMVVLSYGMVTEVPWWAQFTCTAEGGINDLALTRLDGVWGTTAWKDGNDSRVSGVVGDVVMKIDVNARYALAYLDTTVYDGHLLHLGYENSLLAGNKLKSDNDLGQVRPPLPQPLLDLIKRAFQK